MRINLLNTSRNAGLRFLQAKTLIRRYRQALPTMTFSKAGLTRTGAMHSDSLSFWQNTLRRGKSLKVWHPARTSPEFFNSLIRGNVTGRRLLPAPRSYGALAAKLRVLADRTAQTPGGPRGMPGVAYRFYTKARSGGPGKFGGAGAFRGKGRGWRKLLKLTRFGSKLSIGTGLHLGRPRIRLVR